MTFRIVRVEAFHDPFVLVKLTTRGLQRKMPRHLLPLRPTITIIRGAIMTPSIFSGATHFWYSISQQQHLARQLMSYFDRLVSYMRCTYASHPELEDFYTSEPVLFLPSCFLRPLPFCNLQPLSLVIPSHVLCQISVMGKVIYNSCLCLPCI